MTDAERAEHFERLYNGMCESFEQCHASLLRVNAALDAMRRAVAEVIDVEGLRLDDL